MITAAVDNGYKVTHAGHSMGGAVGVLAVVSDERIGNLISLAGMVNTQAFTIENLEKKPRAKAAWEEPDALFLFTKTTCMILDRLRTSRANQSALVLVHGDADDVVPIEDSREIFTTTAPKQIVEIPGANHVFSGTARTND